MIAHNPLIIRRTRVRSMLKERLPLCYSRCANYFLFTAWQLQSMEK